MSNEIVTSVYRVPEESSLDAIVDFQDSLYALRNHEDDIEEIRNPILTIIGRRALAKSGPDIERVESVARQVTLRRPEITLAVHGIRATIHKNRLGLDLLLDDTLDRAEIADMLRMRIWNRSLLRQSLHVANVRQDALTMDHLRRLAGEIPDSLAFGQVAYKTAHDGKASPRNIRPRAIA